jgi:HD-like signal output (HDOD) protein
MSALPKSDPNHALNQLLAKADDIAVLPHVVFRVMEVNGEEEFHGTGLEHAIITDPGFSAKVLTLANSNYDLPRKIASVKEALLFLGFKSVRNLAMTMVAYDMFVGKNDEDSLRRRSWWRHSVDTASCARWIAKSGRSVSPDESYTCGLLHIYGKTMLDRLGEGSYTECSHLIEQGMDIREAELQTFGCDHVEVIVGAARQWGFPESLVQGLKYLDPPLPKEEFGAERATTAMASAIARLARMGHKREVMEIPDWSLNVLGITAEHAESMVEEGIAEITAAQLNL